MSASSRQRAGRRALADVCVDTCLEKLQQPLARSSSRPKRTRRHAGIAASSPAERGPLSCGARLGIAAAVSATTPTAGPAGRAVLCSPSALDGGECATTAAAGSGAQMPEDGWFQRCLNCALFTAESVCIAGFEVFRCRRCARGFRERAAELASSGSSSLVDASDDVPSSGPSSHDSATSDSSLGAGRRSQPGTPQTVLTAARRARRPRKGSPAGRSPAPARDKGGSDAKVAGAGACPPDGEHIHDLMERLRRYLLVENTRGLQRSLSKMVEGDQ